MPPQARLSFESLLGETTPRHSTTAKEAPAVRPKGPGPQVESKPAESRPPPQPSEVRPRSTTARRFHIKRRALAFSVAGVALILIVSLAFLRGPLTLPPLSTTNTQTLTLSQTVTTQGTGPALQVHIAIAKNPVSPGSTQVVSVIVLDPGGLPIPDASVHIQVISPSGQTDAFDVSTDANGNCSHSWHIAASADNVGTFQVIVSAAKDGYQSGRANATFQATTTPEG